MKVERLFSRPACQLGSLAPVANEPIETGNVVEVSQDVGCSTEKEVLGAAASVGTAPQVGGRLGSRVEYGRAREGQLKQGCGGDDLGITHGQIPCHGGGAGCEGRQPSS